MSKGYLLEGEVNSAVQWFKFTATFTDLAAAALTNDIQFYDLPAFGAVTSAYTKITQTFTGGTITAYTIGVGYASNHNQLTGNVAINALSGLNVLQSNNSTPIIYSLSGSTSLRLYATSVGDNLNQATQGSVDIYLQVSFLE